MKNWIRGMVVGACVVALSATAQSPSTTRPGSGMTGTTGSTTGSTTGTTGSTGVTGTAGTSGVAGATASADLPQVPSEPKAYLERLNHVNKTEIEFAELARTKTQNPQVRDLATMLINDHKAATQRVTQLAQQQKLGNLGEPKPMNDVEKRTMAANKAMKEELQTLTGANFDRAFLSHMVMSHDKTLGKLMAGQKQFATAPVSNLITEMVPKVSAHRDQAYRLLGQVKPNVGVGGAGMDSSSGHQGSHQQGK